MGTVIKHNAQCNVVVRNKKLKGCQTLFWPLGKNILLLSFTNIVAYFNKLYKTFRISLNKINI